MKNNEIRDILDSNKLQDILESSRIKWSGHVMRLSKYRVPKKGKRTKNKGNTSTGRPRTREEKFGNERDLMEEVIEKHIKEDRDSWRLLSHTRPLQQ